jgi:hypothetical protein
MSQPHDSAVAYADSMLRRLGFTDPRSVHSGEAEELWDLAYDAYMYRTLPSLGLLPSFGSPNGGKPDRGGLTTVQTDNTNEDDGTYFSGGKL